MKGIEQIAIRHPHAGRPVLVDIGRHLRRHAKQPGHQLPGPATGQGHPGTLAERPEALHRAVIEHGIDGQQPVGHRAPGRGGRCRVQSGQPAHRHVGSGIGLKGQPPAMRGQQAIDVGQAYPRLQFDQATGGVEMSRAGQMCRGVDPQAWYTRQGGHRG